MTLHDFAIELFGSDYLQDGNFKQAMIASSLAYAPQQAQEAVFNCTIDNIVVSGCAAFICERILQIPNFRYSSSHRVVEYNVGYVVETANDIGAVMMLSKSLLLTSRTIWDCDNKVCNSLVAAFSYRTPNVIPRKQAALLLQAEAQVALDAIYKQNPILEFEKMMGLDTLQRYKNLR
ncbi:TPA: hypothetical protein SIA39_003993 [Aeromonas sobria]|nr:hypothetical protein [Aeromonas sobria]